MTQGNPTPRAQPRAEVIDAAHALAAVDTAADGLRAIAAWSAEELAELRAEGTADPKAVLDAWTSIDAGLTKAVAVLDRANRLLDPLTRAILRDLTRDGAIARGTSEGGGETSD